MLAIVMIITYFVINIYRLLPSNSDINDDIFVIIFPIWYYVFVNNSILLAILLILVSVRLYAYKHARNIMFALAISYTTYMIYVTEYVLQS